MPYVIIVNQPGCLPEQDPYAVATIEEAREAANNELRRGTHHGTIDYLPDAAELPEHGGVIGPLPDGYVIDVQRVTLDELARLMPMTPELHRALTGRGDPAFIIDAYNA